MYVFAFHRKIINDRRTISAEVRELIAEYAPEYNATMDVLRQQILSAALSLPKNDRAVLAAELIDSLDPAADADYETAWSEEISHRIAALDAGATKTIPWEKVRDRMVNRAAYKQP
jgi:putative addiction module component (TIGR02574 family)